MKTFFFIQIYISLPLKPATVSANMMFKGRAFQSLSAAYVKERSPISYPR